MDILYRTDDRGRMHAHVDGSAEPTCLVEPDIRGTWAAFRVGGPVAYGNTRDHAVTGFTRVARPVA